MKWLTPSLGLKPRVNCNGRVCYPFHSTFCVQVKFLYFKNHFKLSYTWHCCNVTEQQSTTSFLWWHHCLGQLSGFDSNVSYSSSVFLSVTISSKMTQLSLFEMGGSQAFLSKDWRMTLTPTLTCTHPERHNKKLRWASCPILWSVTGHSVKQSLEKQAMWVQIAQRTLVQNKEPKKLDYLGLKVKNGRWMTSSELCPFGGKCVYVSETFADCSPYSTFSQREARFCQTVTK